MFIIITALKQAASIVLYTSQFPGSEMRLDHTVKVTLTALAQLQQFFTTAR